MNRAAHFLFGQGDDHPLDLPPVAEARDIALVATIRGARRGFEAGIVAKGLDEKRRIGKCRPAGNEGHVHEPIITAAHLAIAVTDAVNDWFTMSIDTQLL